MSIFWDALFSDRNQNERQPSNCCAETAGSLKRPAALRFAGAPFQEPQTCLRFRNGNGKKCRLPIINLDSIDLSNC